MTPNQPNASMEGLKEQFKKEFCSTDPEFEWCMLDLGSIIGGEAIADWWISKFDALLKEAEERTEKNLYEKVKGIPLLKDGGAEYTRNEILNWAFSTKLSLTEPSK